MKFLFLISLFSVIILGNSLIWVRTYNDTYCDGIDCGIDSYCYRPEIYSKPQWCVHEQINLSGDLSQYVPYHFVTYAFFAASGILTLMTLVLIVMAGLYIFDIYHKHHHRFDMIEAARRGQLRNEIFVEGHRRFE
uniref:Uncharacterized protein n=1 Tax=Acrobeloides nanus TaxID=290746 RepID=A0A914EE51_9BILA